MRKEVFGRRPKGGPVHGLGSPLRAFVLGAAVQLASCQSQVGMFEASVTEGTERRDEKPDSRVFAQKCDVTPDIVSPAPLRRLTTVEFLNSLKDVLGVSFDPNATAFPEETSVDGFDNNTGGANISQLRADRMFEVSEQVSVQRVKELAGLFECGENPDAACVDDFIARIGRRMYRAPLSSEEVEVLRGLYNAHVDEDGVAESVGLVIQAMIVSPQFSFRPEVGVATEPLDGLPRIKLNGFELATRLAYFLWSSAPDDLLLDAASQGQLDTPQELEAEVRRMLSDPRARVGLKRFSSQWLSLQGLELVEKDPSLFPDFDRSLAQDMRTETEAFVDRVVWDLDGDFQSLLSSDQSYMNGRLRSLYGVVADEGSEDWAWHTVSAGERPGGVLTQASFLARWAHAAETAPVLRGKYIRDRILCRDIPPPPDNIVPEVAPPDDVKTNRDRLQEHSQGECYACHQFMDPIGFGFEHYDAIGRYREKEEGDLEIDATGEFIGTDDIDGDFNGAGELVKKLVESQQAESCFARNIFQYAHGRRPTKEEGCMIESLTANETPDKKSVQDLFVEIALSDAFRYREAQGENGDD